MAKKKNLFIAPVGTRVRLLVDILCITDVPIRKGAVGHISEVDHIRGVVINFGPQSGDYRDVTLTCPTNDQIEVFKK